MSILKLPRPSYASRLAFSNEGYPNFSRPCFKSEIESICKNSGTGILFWAKKDFCKNLS